MFIGLISAFKTGTSGESLASNSKRMYKMCISKQLTMPS